MKTNVFIEHVLRIENLLSLLMNPSEKSNIISQALYLLGIFWKFVKRVLSAVNKKGKGKSEKRERVEKKISFKHSTRH